ncbi:MAG: acyltransferase [Hyphomicrobiales bacterium]|nr:acyltransferase [Hyphomicrobiales bacterium]
MNKATSHFIDASRWIAALLVVLFHAHNIFVNQADIMTAPHHALEYVWWFFITFAFAHEGLVMFFVFSGVLVGGAVIQRMKKPEKFFKRYLIDRIVRIYIVLIPVLAIGFCVDNLGRWLFAGRGVYELPHFAETFQAWLLLPTLASLQGIWFSTYGTNEPLWSLGMECWYYVVFPLLFLPMAFAYTRTTKIIGGLSGVAVYAVLALSGSYFAFGFLPWIVGAGARLAPRPLMRSKYLALFLWVAASVIIRLTVRGSALDQFPTKAIVDGLNALLCANLILTLRFDTGEGFRFCNTKLHKFMADFSYSVYALHLPILFFLWGATAELINPGWHAELASLPHYLAALGASALVLALAYGLSRVTEARTESVRRVAHNLLRSPERPAQQPATAG